MNNAVIRYVFDKKKQADNSKKTGLLQIEVRLLGTNKCAYISTGIHLYKNQFSDANGFSCRSHPNAVLITRKARGIFNEIEAYVLSDKCASLADVHNWDKQDKAGTQSFISFMRKTLARNNPSMATLEHHNGLIRRLEEFGIIKTFSDLTYENICLFDAFLRKKINSSATLNKRHSTLKQYIREAISMDMLTKNPYDRFRMPQKKSKEPTFLTDNEIKKILDYTPGNDKLSKVKDLFIFQMFTGMAYVDLCGFCRAEISEYEGHRIIRSSRTKTDESFISLFLPEAERIAEKYNYNLPRLSNQKYNDYLKLLGAGAGLEKTLTSHVARHTYATYLLNKGVPVETVSRAMGHSNIKQTQHYARMLGKTVIEDMKKML
ncbi:MAG: site-specific integrase [Tannerellaceae bacterium]|jgi:site-specific recombinase XerD|nr:site-specific integrase [Tannerellaceae bacterium]